MVGYCLRNNILVVSLRVTALGCIFGVTSGWGGKGANAQCAEERRNFACYAVASHSKYSPSQDVYIEWCYGLTTTMATWTSGYLRDLEAPNALLDVATRRARGGDLIFLATGPDATSLAMAQNTVHMLARLGLQGNAMLLADSLETWLV